MAIDDEPNTDTPIVGDFAKAFLAEAMDPKQLEKLQRMLVNALTEGIKIVFFGISATLSTLAAPIVEGILGGEEAASGAYSKVAAAALSAMFNVHIDQSEMRPFSMGGHEGAARAIGDAVFRGMAEPHLPLEPGDANAKKYIGTMVNIGVEGWLNGFIFELATEVSTLGYVKPEKFAELKDVMIQVLGLSRLSRRVFGPYVNTLIVEPFKWQLNKTYRPQMLGAALLAREVARGRKTREQAFEELARQGWSDDRIEAMLSDSRKKLGASDITFLQAHGGLTDQAASDLYKDLGYDDATAKWLLLIEQLKSDHALEQKIADAAEAAYIVGGIDRAELLASLQTVYPDPHERELVSHLVDLKKAARGKRISKGDIEDCVQRGISSMIDFRHWCELEGYDDDSTSMMELRLSSVIQGKEAAETERKRIAKEKAAAKAIADAEAAKRKADLEARAAHGEPEIGDIKTAVVRGFVPMGRYQDALTERKYSSSDIAFLIDVLQQQRDEYVAAAKKRVDAEAAALVKGLSLGDLERAYVDGIFSRADYERHLSDIGYSSADVAVLSAVAEGKRQAKIDAEARRVAAQKQLADKGLSLDQAQRAVKSEIWTIAQYEQWLSDAGFNAGAASILSALLRDDIERTARAEQKRNEIAAQLKVAGVSLSDLETAVLQGVRPIADYSKFLAKKNYPPEDAQLLVDLLTAKLADQAAAKAKQEEAANATKDRALTWAQVVQAVKLGTVTIDAARHYLTTLKYTAADAQLLIDSLAIEIQQQRAAEAQRAKIAAELLVRHLSLADMERAVYAGEKTVPEYRAFVQSQGYAAGDADLLAQLVADKLKDRQEAERLHAAVAAQLKAKTLTLSQWDDAVGRGERTLGEYVMFVTSLGYSADDAQLLADLLTGKLTDRAKAEELHAAAAAKAAVKVMSLAQWEKAVGDNLRTFEDYAAFLTAQGYEDADVQVLVTLLGNKLGAAAAKAKP